MMILFLFFTFATFLSMRPEFIGLFRGSEEGLSQLAPYSIKSHHVASESPLRAIMAT